MLSHLNVGVVKIPSRSRVIYNNRQAIIYNVGIALNNFYSNKCQLFCTRAWSPGGKRGGILCKLLTLQTLRRWITTGNGNSEENGSYTLLISRQEEIIRLVKPLLPKPTIKLRVIHITVIPLVSLPGPAELVRLLRFWPDQFFSLGKSKFHFCKRQVINKVLVWFWNLLGLLY